LGIEYRVRRGRLEDYGKDKKKKKKVKWLVRKRRMRRSSSIFEVIGG
jgi:hypothetical protein